MAAKQTNNVTKSRVLSLRIDGDKFDNISEQLAAIASTTVSKSGKLGVTSADVLELLLNNHVTNLELKDFINRDFHEQSSEQNRRIDELTNAVNNLTLTVENLRNIFALTFAKGDANVALTLINTLSSGAIVEQASGDLDFEFTTTSRHDIDTNEDDLIAAFEQIKTSDYDDNTNSSGAKNPRLVTNFRTLKEPRNFKKRLNT